MLGLIAGTVSIAGYVPYVRDILRQSTKPDKISWLIWLLEYSVLFVAQMAEGARGSLWLVGLQLAGVIVITVLSFRFGVGKFDKRKLLLLVGVCSALVLWFFTKSAVSAILISLAVEISGVILTITKVYREPESETLTMWALLSVSGVLGIFAAMSDNSPVLFIYPITLVGIGLSVICASLAGSRKQQLASVSTPSNQELFEQIVEATPAETRQHLATQPAPQPQPSFTSLPTAPIIQVATANSRQKCGNYILKRRQHLYQQQ